MHVEKLNLLEKRLEKFVECFAQLKEDNEALRLHLESKSDRIVELEAEVDGLKRRREQFRVGVDRVNAVVKKLEQYREVETAN